MDRKKIKKRKHVVNKLILYIITGKDGGNSNE